MMVHSPMNTPMRDRICTAADVRQLVFVHHWLKGLICSRARNVHFSAVQ